MILFIESSNLKIKSPLGRGRGGKVWWQGWVYTPSAGITHPCPSREGNLLYYSILSEILQTN